MVVHLALAGANMQCALAVLRSHLLSPVWCSLLMMFPTVHLIWFVLLNSLLTLSISLLTFLTLLLMLLSELLLFWSSVLLAFVSGPWMDLSVVCILFGFHLAFVWWLWCQCMGSCCLSFWTMLPCFPIPALLCCMCLTRLPGFSLFYTFRGDLLIEQPALEGSVSSTAQHRRIKLLHQQQ